MNGSRVRISRALDCDVAVVGAGPAGAATATLLARAGLHAILIDAKAFPRDKVCGDFVGPVAIRELQALGVSDLPGYAESNVVHRAALFLDGVELIESAIPEVPPLPAHGRVVPRLELDDWVLTAARRAGVRVLEHRRVREIHVQDDGAVVALDGAGAPGLLQARMIVGADGSNSTVARFLHGHGPPEQSRIVAVRAYYENVAGPADRCDLYFSGSSFPGYYWLFPTGPTTANVGVGMLQDTFPPTREHLRDLLLDLVAKDAALGARLQRARLVGKVMGWPLATYEPGEAVVGDRVLLAGDAAGLINPLNGEGIQYALLSARWATETIADCALRGDFSAAALGSYARRVHAELDYDMALARTVVGLIRNRSLNAAWLAALRVIVSRARVDPRYADITGGVLAGLVPASSVLELDVIASTVKQAVVSTAFAAAGHALRGPSHLGRVGRAALDWGLSAGASMARDPAHAIEWGAGVAISGTSLLYEVVRHRIDAMRASKTLPAEHPQLRIRVRG